MVIITEMFQGIRIPDQIAIPTSYLRAIEDTAKRQQETIQTAILGGIVFAAFWGENISESGYNPDFVHGIFDATTSCFDALDIPLATQQSTKRFSEREKYEAQLGLRREPALNFFSVPEVLHTELRSVAGYYDCDPILIMGLAIVTRQTILSLQDEDFSYCYSPDQEQWYFATVESPC